MRIFNQDWGCHEVKCADQCGDTMTFERMNKHCLDMMVNIETDWKGTYFSNRLKNAFLDFWRILLGKKTEGEIFLWEEEIESIYKYFDGVMAENRFRQWKELE